MMLFIPLLALSIGASARAFRRDAPACLFTMTAIGEPSANGTVREAAGQARILGSYPQGAYYLQGQSLFDSFNNQCLLSASYQLLCGPGQVAMNNFTVARDAYLAHDGIEAWVACPAAGPGDDGSYNIFGNAKALDTGCEPVTLKTLSACSKFGATNTPSFTATSSTITVTSSVSVTTTTAPATTTTVSVTTTSVPTTSSTTSNPAVCPTDISSGTFQFPHLIIPTSPQAPDYPFGNSLNATISPANNTLFDFDIPPTAPWTGTCSLLFLFPYASDADPAASKYYFSGYEEELGEKGGLEFSLLNGVVTETTTFTTTPTVATDYGKTQIVAGNNYTIATFPCPSGERVSFQVGSVGNVELAYFQDYAPSPIGVYVVPCV